MSDKSKNKTVKYSLREGGKNLQSLERHGVSVILVQSKVLAGWKKANSSRIPRRLCSCSNECTPAAQSGLADDCRMGKFGEELTDPFLIVLMMYDYRGVKAL